MKTYMVTLAVDWKEDSNNSPWWRCVKASSEKVAAKRAVERVCKQISFTDDVQAIWVEPITIQKVIGVLQAYDAREEFNSRIFLHVSDMLSTIRRNAPELHADAQRRILDAKIAKLDAERIDTFWAAMDCGHLCGDNFWPYDGKEAKAKKLWARLGELLDALREAKKLRAKLAAE